MVIDPVRDGLMLMAGEVIDGERGESTVQRALYAVAMVSTKHGDKLRSLTADEWRQLVVDELTAQKT